MADYSVHVVIDNGTSTCKAGFNGENAPRVVIPTVVGVPKTSFFNIMEDESRIFVGRDALANAGYLKTEYPIQGGKYNNIALMEKMWSDIFYNQLKVKPEAHNVFLTENLYTSDEEREKIAEILFENFSVFNIHFEPQPVMTLYSTAKTSGLIVESSESMTQVVPIFEGYVIPQGVQSIPLGGELVTQTLFKHIEPHLEHLNVLNKSYITKRVKEKFCEINIEGETNVDAKIKKEFTLPDGNKIKIGLERFSVPEILFNPNLIDLDCLSVHSAILESIANVDIYLRKDFLNNMILGGGNTMIKNFPERLKKEILQHYSLSKEVPKIKINAQNERIYSAWIGASVVCSIGNFQQMWISKNDFEEIGKHVIRKKYNF